MILKRVSFPALILFYLLPFSGLSQKSTLKDSLLSVVVNTRNDSIKAKTYFELSLAVREKDFESGIEYALRALDFAAKNSDSDLKYRIAVNTATFFLQKGLFDQAVSFFKIQLDLGKELDNDNITGKAYYNLGLIRLVLEDYQIAKEYFEKAMMHLNRFSEANGAPLTDMEEVTIDNSLGLVYTGLNQYDLASSVFLKGIEISKNQEQLRPQYCQIAKNYAYLLIKKNELEEAKSILYEVFEIEESSQNKVGEIATLLYLGKAELQSGNPKAAISFLSKGLTLAQSLSGFSDKKHLTSELAAAFESLNIPDSSLHYLNFSLAYEDSLTIQKAKDELLKNELGEQFELVSRGLKKESESFKERFEYAVLLSLSILGLFLLVYFLLSKRLKSTESKHSKLILEHGEVLDVNQELNSELQLKEQEIILNKMQSSKSNELILELSNRIKEVSHLRENTPELTKLIGDLKTFLGDNSWTEFEVRFKQVHGEFYEKLLQAYPNLTMNERRLAAFLKLQMTSKEISKITGQSTRAVELARTRMRKKLGLTNSENNLYDFFLAFGSEE
jgi:tetratricopeptide (TPR) repeat protein